MTHPSLIEQTVVLPGGGQVASLQRNDEGGGHAVVFLHGIGSRARSFAPLLERMPPGFQLLAWDAPGYGASTPLPQASPLPLDYAHQLARVLDAASIGQVDLVGHSLGCLMAGAFALAFPERVRRVVLMSPALGYKVTPGTALPENLQRRIDDFETLGAAQFAATRSQNLIHRPETKPALVEAVRTAMATLTMPGYGQAMRMLGAGRLVADARQLRQDVLVLSGTEDKVTPLAGSLVLRSVLRDRAGERGGRDAFVSVPDAGHAVYLEAPAAVADAICDFVNGGVS